MEFSFEKNVINPENPNVIPEINGSTVFAENEEIPAERLLEYLEAARENSDS